jgi:solute:Na+ symporter, SSS family
MLQLLGTADYILLVLLLGTMVFSGVVIGLKKKNAEQYFMANRSLKWWSVAGSIYGTNVSLSQIIGMLGIGYSIGFAQAHYEVLAIPAILLLCYVFIPVYRKQKVFTLSQFLESRYNEYTRLLYTVIIISIIVILLVGGFYIGSRQLGLLFNGSSIQITYLQGIVLIAFITCLLIYFGGMESVVMAENIQTVLMVVALLLVGVFTLWQPEIGSFNGLLLLDAQQADGNQKMHLYLPSHHKDLPWTGVFSGLMVLHSFFWTTNQFEVQRILAAETDRQAKLGAIAAGFLKLTIPFFSIAAGVAAAYIFTKRGITGVKPDDAFMQLTGAVVPQGYGLIGIIIAGFTAAIFSSIYSMMNSASTLLSVDVYKKYIHRSASDRQMVQFGRWSVVLICTLSAALAYVTFNPQSNDNFFLTLSKNTSYLKPGIVSAFFLGVFWKQTKPASAIAAIVLAPVFGLCIEWLYSHWLVSFPAVQHALGAELNFMHRVFITFVFCVLLQVSITALYNKNNETIEQHTVYHYSLKFLLKWLLVFLLLQLPCWLLIEWGWLSNRFAAWIAAAITFALFLYHVARLKKTDPFTHQSLWQSDLFYAGILSAVAVFILYYFA